jgi:hypothetical protein
MSFETYSDDCPGCRPMVLDMQTKRPLPDDSPMMLIINGIWSTTTRDEREAFHRFTCQNSRAPEVMALVNPLMMRIQNALKN